MKSRARRLKICASLFKVANVERIFFFRFVLMNGAEFFLIFSFDKSIILSMLCIFVISGVS